jgi:hypothetical protein
MSTRGAYGFKANGKYYVTYNHSDSYAKGLGAEVVKFCDYVNAKDGWNALKSKVKKVTLVNEDKKPTRAQIRKYAVYGNTAVGNQTLDDWYCLLRNLQYGEILYGIESGKVKHMTDSFEFMADSLFCEYGYIINLDEMTLDFYRGFQEKPCKNNLPLPMVADKDTKYYPVTLRAVFQLDGLPHNWLK